jgi:hypothetical protein
MAAATAAQKPMAPLDASVVVRAAPVQGRQWTVTDDGHFITAENAVLRLKFAYNANSYQGWFMGTTSGGGGRDGGIVELYYKPTSATRNLIFRNGTWGSGLDNMDFWEAEHQGGAGFTAPDLESGRHAVMNSSSVSESAGRLTATFDFQFAAWRIIRTYIVYPWGDITVHAQLTVTQTSNWNYLGHRFSFGVSPYSFNNGTTTYNWGARYRAESESYHAWTDGAPSGTTTENFYQYSRRITSTIVENSVNYEVGRQDHFGGFLIDDASGNDPDIIVMAGDPNIHESPFQQIPKKLSSEPGIGAYIETAIWNYDWAPQGETAAQMTYFYMTTPSNQVSVSTPWPTSLGTWRETFHVMFRRDFGAADYLALWKARTRDIVRAAPTSLSGGKATLNSTDALYHIKADNRGSTIQFDWTRPSMATNSIDYRTAFVIESFSPGYVEIQGVGAPALDAYYDSRTRQTLLVMSGPQAPQPQTYTIKIGK